MIEVSDRLILGQLYLYNLKFRLLIFLLLRNIRNIAQY
jgi:hypothetical protein